MEVGGNGRGFKEVDEILKQANYTKVLHLVSGQDNIYTIAWKTTQYNSNFLDHLITDDTELIAQNKRREGDRKYA